MGNIIFVTDEWTQLATVTLETSHVSTPASNLLTIDPHEFWRSNDVIQPVQLRFTRTANTPFADTIYLGYHNGTSLSQWRIRGFTEPNDVTNPDFDSGTIDLWPHVDLEDFVNRHALYRHPTLFNSTNVRIDIFDGGNPDGFFRAGIVRIANAFQPSVNLSQQAGFAFGPVDPSELLPTFGGAPKIRAREPYSTLLLNMEGQLAGDAHEFVKLARFYGNRFPVVVYFDPDGTWMTFRHDALIYALLGFDDPPVNGGQFHRRFSVSVSGREFF